MTYHIQIQQERRTTHRDEMVDTVTSEILDADGLPTGERTSTSIYRAVPVRQGAIPVGDQLHTLSAENLADRGWSDPQFVMVAEWDMKSPYVICHKGDYSARTMSYAGWPDVTQEQYDQMESQV